MPRKPCSIPLSSEFNPSFVSLEFCSFSKCDIICSQNSVKSDVIILGFNRSGLKIFLLSDAIKYVSAISSTHVSISLVNLSNSRCDEYLFVDQWFILQAYLKAINFCRSSYMRLSFLLLWLSFVKRIL